MKGLHSDIGGEMSNAILEDVSANLTIRPTTTAAYSPHQNGLNERNHSTVDTMMLRMKESDPNMTPEMILSWALHAKNSLENCYGFSPFQLHIGYNPMLPSATRDGPPALEGVTKSQTFANHLNTMHLAREEFIKAESSAVLKRALKSKIFPRGEDIQEKDWIYYKKDDNKSKEKIFRGPAQVVATNGKKLFIDQGARLGTVNRDNAVRVGEEFWRAEHLPIEEEVQVEETDSEEIDSDDSESSDSDSQEADRTRNNNQLDEPKSSTESSDTDNSEEEVEDEESTNSEHEASENGSEGEENQPNHIESTEVSNEPQVQEHFSFKEIKKHDVIRYKFNNSDWETAKVQSRAGKSSGVNKYWWNVKVKATGHEKCVNTENFEETEKVIDEDHEEVMVVVIPRNLHYQPACIQAKEKELQNWEDFGVYEEVQDEGQKTLGTNWVMVMKIIDGKEVPKARLCVRGDLEEDVDLVRRDSPTVNKTNIKLFYLIAMHRKWKIKTADVKAAFLQGSDLDREVYLKPPKERRIPGVIWKMIKRAYGFWMPAEVSSWN